ncbi:MAG TPA: hydantoinase/oxoprolinase family protein, partial [Burkholderiales bacterium]|nr:hydantoinase/oxoprolinase family protein [Burkholderiales bacterium]
STVVANAYVGPRVGRYLGEIASHLQAESFPGEFLLVQSTGGLFRAAQAQSECVRILESGPAAGVIGTRALCQRLGVAQAIAFDMGGTTAKAGVIHHGAALTKGATLVGGYAQGLPVQIPMIDIFEVGTGGGSIASLDEAGALRVGPQSAGADPGPACYGRGGTAATVTDANLLLGRLDGDRFLGGEMKLDGEAARAAIGERVARPLGMAPARAADGILRIAVTAMSHAVKGVSTDRGLDAAAFTLVAYGGAGPLHASAIAREIGMKRFIVPRAPGHFCAFGMLHSDLRYDYVRSWFTRLDDVDAAELERRLEALAKPGRHRLGRRPATVCRALDMRYVGQEHPVSVDLPRGALRRERVKALFDAEHLRRYGTNAPAERAEIVSLRATVTGKMSKPPLEKIRRGTARPPRESLIARHKVWFGERWRESPVYARERLLAGNRIAGPALVEEHASTTVLQPGDRLTVDAFGNLDVEVGR